MRDAAALAEHPLFATRVVLPEDLSRRAEEAGWPDGLLQRALDLRVPRHDVEFWLDHGFPPPEEIHRHLDTVELLQAGPLQGREATWRDAERLVDLYADAPEDVGDWQLTVERGPNPFAQFRLQEHVNMQVLDCRGVALAAKAHSTRNSLIGGERYTVHVMSAWRVRAGFRGMGLSRVMQALAGPASAWVGMVTCWYERTGNASQGWLDKARTMVEARDGHKVEGLTATVHLFEPRPVAPLPIGLVVRPTEPADVARCVELINATHRGLDLFRPYSGEFLEGRLDDPFWGPQPGWWTPVYRWGEHFVVEDGGEIVACGGLWDRGGDVREVWRRPDTGEERVLEPTALMDWGHALGRDDAMAALARRFLVRTGELGRTHLLAPLEFAPGVLDALGDLEPTIETRALRCMGFHEGDVHIEPSVQRPYTDLAYW
jgi:hypothetical protein